MNFIGNSKLIIHNAKFDIGFINYEIQRLIDNNLSVYEKLPYKEIKSQKVIDTLDIAKKLYPGKSVSLDLYVLSLVSTIREKENMGHLLIAKYYLKYILNWQGENNQPSNFHNSAAKLNILIEKQKEKETFLGNVP